MHILVIEDDSTVSGVLQEGLASAGHSLQGTGTGEEGLDLLRENSFDLIILDVGLPGIDGYEVATRIRKEGDTTPLIMLTARDTEADVIRGLNLGADGYITKPFSVPELLARLRALERRESLAGQAHLSFSGLEADQRTREVTYCGNPIRITEIEFQLLYSIASARGRTVTREELLKDVWGMDFDPQTTVFDVHLSNLRKKLNAAGPPLIETLRGVGYRIVNRGD